MGNEESQEKQLKSRMEAFSCQNIIGRQRKNTVGVPLEFSCSVLYTS